MKRIMNNLRSWQAVLNFLLIAVVMAVIKTSNGVQNMKMLYFKIFGIPYRMDTDPKSSAKLCYRETEDSDSSTSKT